MQRRSFSHVIFRTFLLSVFTLSFLSGLILALGKYQDYRHKSAETYDNAMRAHRSLLHRSTQGIKFLAESKLLNIEDSLKQEIFYHTQEAIDIAYEIYDDETLQNNQQTIRTLIRETLRGVKYNNGTGYYFIADMDEDRLVLYPPAPHLEGRLFTDLGETWTTRHAEQQNQVKTFGDGFQRYFWPKPGDDRTAQEKISFVKLFAPYNWYIGTGMYITDFTEVSLDQIVKDVQAFSINDKNLVLIDAEGTVRVGEIGADIQNELFVNGQFIQEDGRLYYAERIEPIGWTIGSSADISFIGQEVKNHLLQIKRDAAVQLSLIVSVTILLSLLFSWILKKNSLRIKSGFDLFAETFRRAATTNQTIPDDNIHFTELHDLSITANQMIEENKRIKDDLNDYKHRLEILVDERTADLKTAQDKLLTQERLAVLGQLTATVSHELRNPLGTLRNALHNLELALKIDNQKLVQSSLEISERNIHRCDRIINELLDYGRDATLERQAIDINTFLKDHLAEIPLPDDIHLSLALGATATIFADPELLHRVLVNLMLNAQQALEDTARSDKQIEVTTEVVGERLEITFRDNGPGIAAENRDRIFEPLFSTKSFGVGLGMTIVKNILQKHQGDIRLLDQDRPGGCFVLWLPLHQQSEEA